MENKNGFVNGLLLGAVIGAGAVFLLGTKKGKKLLKAITEEGLEGVSELEELLENKLDEGYEELSIETPRQTPVTKKVDKAQIQPSEESIKMEKEPVQEVEKPSVGSIARSGKRFFRGVPRKR